MSHPANYDFNFYEGDSEDIVLRLKDINDSFVDLTNYIVTLEVKKNKFGDILHTKVGEVDEDYNIVFGFTKEEVTELSSFKNNTKYVFDVDMTDKNTDQRNTILYGSLFVHRGVNP